MKTIVVIGFEHFAMPEKDVSTFLEIMKRCEPVENQYVNDETLYVPHPKQKHVKIRFFTVEQLDTPPTVE